MNVKINYPSSLRSSGKKSADFTAFKTFRKYKTKLKIKHFNKMFKKYLSFLFWFPMFDGRANFFKGIPTIQILVLLANTIYSADHKL